jgi:predicted dithiol-disulfide oxidoreductase (DUF899 family)
LVGKTRRASLAAGEGRLIAEVTQINEQRGPMMQNHKVVSHGEWLEARKKLLAGEKEFTWLRDQLSKERRELPWERVDKNYVFDGPEGKQSLLGFE